MKRVIIFMLDSFGIGQADDAAKFGDEGSDTLGHIAEKCFHNLADNGRNIEREIGEKGALKLPNLTKYGLVNAYFEANKKLPLGMNLDPNPIASYAFAAEISSGKDTPSGHWEMAGVPVLFDWGYYRDLTNSFPEQLLAEIYAKTTVKGCLGNCHASGTKIINELGDEHVKTGLPIFYTSADSVFQIAAHEQHFGLENLYTLCEQVRAILPDNIGRVIARPFVGEKNGEYVRTGNRHDYAIEPPSKTVLQKLVEAGGSVTSVGKIADIYANTGISEKYKATGLTELFDVTLQAIAKAGDNSIIFTNFVDFDSAYGHTRNPAGYAGALEYFDSRMPELEAYLQAGDLVIITADHGCDPTFKGTEHTREFVPVLIRGAGYHGEFLGKRATFSDTAQTIASYLGLEKMDYGTKL